MIPKFSSQTESDEFLTLSKTIQAGSYENALTMSKEMLEKYPDNKHIYHNQIGAMIYLSKNDYWGATRHYEKALEYGFPADTCEDNIWESAEDSFKFLIDSEAGFCAVMGDDGNIVTRVYTLVENYKNVFPSGKFNDKADELLFIYENIAGSVFDDAEALRQAYNSSFADANYNELLDELCRIYFK
ncbi:hypothetical protein AAEO56_11215 [Flavobacterium sp. DGU11]|uniref:Tetratricopeptide repeat-containing protein n=1 Tax=Flavobacterium arundinis TaxID=3139143 RepID=A0ABU9HXD4_9FLAO